MKRGVVYVAYGEKAVAEAEQSIASLRRVHPDLVVDAISDVGFCGNVPMDRGGEFTQLSPVQKSRLAKTVLHQWSQFDLTLYLDADTRVYQPLDAVFEMLLDGWEMVICPSANQGDELMWHINPNERAATLEELGYAPLQLQGGVFAFRKCERVEAFFDTWRAEWRRWQDQDQAALLRALSHVPLRMCLLGHPFNGGAVIGHRFGQARAVERSYRR